MTGDITMIRLRAGDVLLVQGSRENIESLKESGSMLVLDGTTDLPHTQKAKRALAIMGVVILAAATGVLPISVAAVAGWGQCWRRAASTGVMRRARCRCPSS